MLVLTLAGCGLGQGGEGEQAAESRPTSTTPTPVSTMPAAATGQPAVPADAGARVAGRPGADACGATDGTPVARPPRGSAASGPALVTVGALNLRAGPGTDCPVVGSMGFGMTVELGEELVQRDGRLWRRLSGPAGAGYALADAFEAMPSQQPAAVPVLLYHHISDEADSRYYVSPERFEEQLQWLRDNRYVSMTPSDLANAAFARMPLPEKPVMLTIDDGNPSTMTFKALLDEYGFRGVYFLPNLTGLSDEQIRELATSGEVCGHTVNHPDLAKLSEDEQRVEIVDNKAWLEEIVGAPVTCFGYPFGTYNKVTDDVVEDAGYEIAFNAWGGVAVLGEIDPWHVLRREVYRDFTLDDFIAAVEERPE